MNSLNGKRTVFNSVKRYCWYEKKPFNFSKCYCLSRGEKQNVLVSLKTHFLWLHLWHLFEMHLRAVRRTLKTKKMNSILVLYTNNQPKINKEDDAFLLSLELPPLHASLLWIQARLFTATQWQETSEDMVQWLRWLMGGTQKNFGTRRSIFVCCTEDIYKFVSQSNLFESSSCGTRLESAVTWKYLFVTAQIASF